MTVVLPKSLSDHPSLVGVIRFPCITIDLNLETIEVPLIMKNSEGKWVNMKQQLTMSKELQGRKYSSSSFTVPKSKITDFYPYTYYVLSDGECDPLVLHPQYLPNTIKIEGEVALSHQPIERYFIDGYKGDQKGHNYNITNLNQMMLPTASNEGIGYMSANANTIMQNRKSQITGNTLSAISGIGATIGAAATGNIGLALGVGMNSIGNSINGINEIKNTDARYTDQTLTPNSISSFGTPSTRDKFDNNKVRLLKYTIQDKYKNKINDYVERFGYKFNKFDNIDLKTYKGYIKMIMPDIDGKIDNIYMNKIISILERGVYIE